jgi:hypothetical protein
VNKLMTALQRINAKIAVGMNKAFATMAFFYVCFALSLLPLRWPDSMPFVQYLSSGVLQLIALPLLGVGTVLASQDSFKQNKEQHDAVMELLAELHERQAQATSRMNDLHQKLEKGTVT